MTTLLLPRLIAPVPKPPTWLRGDWRCGIGAGTKLGDLSRYRAHGTITGADWVAGAHGYALDFDKAAVDYVEILANHTQLNFTSGPFSIVARVKVETYTGYPVVFCRGFHQIDGYLFQVYNKGQLSCSTYQSTKAQRSYSSEGDIVVATWYTIGLSRDGASVKLFKNGVDVTSTAAVHINPTTSARTPKIGIYDDKASSPFDGLMEFLGVFGVALSDSEHLAWHNALA